MLLRPNVSLSFCPTVSLSVCVVSHCASARTRLGGFPLKLNIGVSYIKKKSVEINPHLAKIVSKYPVLYMDTFVCFTVWDEVKSPLGCVLGVKCYQGFRIIQRNKYYANAPQCYFIPSISKMLFFKSPG